MTKHVADLWLCPPDEVYVADWYCVISVILTLELIQFYCMINDKLIQITLNCDTKYIEISSVLSFDKYEKGTVG